MLNLLFVYGTLRGEFDNPHARLLRERAERLGRATVRGSIYRIAHYPGFRPSPAGTVVGELYRLWEPGDTLAAFDSYEGEEYERVTTEVLHEGQTMDAWIYSLHEQPPEAARIESGDFCAL